MLLLITSCGNLAFANTTLIGKPCPKEGAVTQIGNSGYKCVAYGKKLLWIASTPPKKFDTLISFPLLDSGLKDLQARVKPFTYKDLVDIKVEKGLENYTWVKDSVSSINSGLQMLSAFNALPDEKVVYFYFWNESYPKSLLSKECFELGTWAGGGKCAPIALGSLKWFGDRTGITSPKGMNSYSDEIWKYGIISSTPHEMGHLGQQTLWRKFQIKVPKPAWIREGTSELFKVLSYANQNKISYSKSRVFYMQGGDACKGVPLKSLSDTISYPSSCEYSNGMLAMEYLIQKIGSIDALFYWDTKANGMNIKERFRSAYNLDWDKFLVEADAYIKKQYR